MLKAGLAEESISMPYDPLGVHRTMMMMIYGAGDLRFRVSRELHVNRYMECRNSNNDIHYYLKDVMRLYLILIAKLSQGQCMYGSCLIFYYHVQLMLQSISSLVIFEFFFFFSYIEKRR